MSTASLVKKYGWREWLCHTNFSFLAGASHPDQYIDAAINGGYNGLGFCDFDGVYGLARAYLELKKRQKSSETSFPIRESANRFRLFYGAELRLGQEHQRPIVLQDTLALYATSHLGYRNLTRLCSLAHRDGKSNANVPLQDLLNHDVTDVVAIQPMRGLVRRQPNGKGSLYEQRCAEINDHFGGRLYFAISRHHHPSEDAWIRPTIELARRLGCQWILSQDPFFHHPSQKDLNDTLHAIRHNLVMDEAVSQMFVNDQRCLLTLDELDNRYRVVPRFEQALKVSLELAESINFELSELRYHYPKEMIPSGSTPQLYLEQLVWKAAETQYGSPIPGRMVEILSHELDLIKTLAFADYFLTVWDIVRWAREQNILCQGRGSAANSAVCFVLGITSVDPSLFDLLFERFVSVERGDPPDIDVDFEHERREEVIQYIYRRYGRSKAAMVANVITFQRKGALRAVGKAFGIDERRLGQVSKLLQARFFRQQNAENVLNEARMDLKPMEQTDLEELRNVRGTIPWELWAEMAERLRGFPRHLGLHSGGFMLADKHLDWLVPQEPATMADRTVIQWSKDDIEGLGFFKIDVLALGMLTAMRKTMDSIRKHYNHQVSLASIPHDDGPTYAMIQRADTVGTFQIESRAQMSMLPRMRPRSFYDLVIEVAIIRPGPIQGGMVHPFLKRREGAEPVVFPDDRLRPILARTLGIPIFQEQVMRIGIEVGDFTPGEANELRRNMGAFTIKGDLSPWLKKLASGMRRNQIAEEFIQSVLDQMKGFASYGFPESHAVSFALIAYGSSWLKCHYPAAFYMGVMNSQPMGFYSVHALTQAAMRNGVTFLPVCANTSDWDHKLENIALPERPPLFAIRLGFRIVKGLSEKGARQLLKVREELGGSFESLIVLLQRSGLNRADLTCLAAANAFEGFGLDRRAALWLAEAAPFNTNLEDREVVIAWDEETQLERMQQDFSATTTSLGPHPTILIKVEHWCFKVPLRRISLAKDLAHMDEGCQVFVFGMILVRQAPPSAKGMVFFTLEDESHFLNLAFTPTVYERSFPIVEQQTFLCVRGKLQKVGSSHSILVHEVLKPEVERASIVDIAKWTKPKPFEDNSRKSSIKELESVEVWQNRLAHVRNYM